MNLSSIIKFLILFFLICGNINDVHSQKWKNKLNRTIKKTRDRVNNSSQNFLERAKHETESVRRQTEQRARDLQYQAEQKAKEIQRIAEQKQREFEEISNVSIDKGIEIYRKWEGIDATKNLQEKLRRNFNLSSLKYRVNSSYYSLNSILKTKTTLLQDGYRNFDEAFRKNKHDSLVLGNLLKYESLSKNISSFNIFNRNYNLYRLDEDVYISVSNDKQLCPIDETLNQVLLSSHYKNNISLVNADLIRNMKNISSALDSYFSGIIDAIDSYLKGYNWLDSYKIGPLSAVDMVDYMVKPSIGMSIANLTTEIREQKNDLEILKDLCHKLKESLTVIQKDVAKTLKSRSINYEDVIVSLENFVTVSSQISRITKKINSYSVSINSFSNTVDKLTQSSDYEFITSIGEVFSNIHSSIDRIEKSVKDFGDSFKSFAIHIEAESKNIYNSSFTDINGILKQHYEKTFPEITTILSIKDNLNYDWNTIRPIAFFIQVQDLNKNIEIALNKDVKTYHDKIILLKSIYNSYSPTEVKNYYLSILKLIDDKRFWLGFNLDAVSEDFESHIMAYDSNDKDYFFCLMNKTSFINNMYSKVQIYNIITFILFGIVLISGVVYMHWRFRKKDI